MMATAEDTFMAYANCVYLAGSACNVDKSSLANSPQIYT